MTSATPVSAPSPVARRSPVGASPAEPVRRTSLLDSCLTEVLAALGCTTLAAVPSAFLAHSLGRDIWIGVLVGGLLAYALLTGGENHRRRAPATATPEPVDPRATLRQRLAEVEERAAAARPVAPSGRTPLRVVR